MKSRRWMAEALKEAFKGLGNVSPNPPVGAVIVRGGRVVARGYHHRYGGPHAEIEAMVSARARGVRLSGSTLIVSLEPCDHFGKTPPCTAAILREGIRNVVVGMPDPHRIVAGRGIRRLRRAGVRVDVLNDPEVIRFYEPYRTFQELGRSYVTLKLALSADGRIAGGSSRWITGPASRREVQRIRRRVDAVLVGRRTAVVDNPRLTLRPAAGRRPLVRVVLSASGRLPKNLRILTDGAAPTMVVPSPAAACRRLADRGVVHLLVEGGASTARSFLDSGLVDEVMIFVSPKRMGLTALPAFLPPTYRRKTIIRWRLTEARRIGADTLMVFRHV